MTQFRVGDQVERIGSLVPDYMRTGVVTRIVTNKDGDDWFSEYAVDFGRGGIVTLYETQLRLLKAATVSKLTYDSSMRKRGSAMKPS